MSTYEVMVANLEAMVAEAEAYCAELQALKAEEESAEIDKDIERRNELAVKTVIAYTLYKEKQQECRKALKELKRPSVIFAHKVRKALACLF